MHDQGGVYTLAADKRSAVSKPGGEERTPARRVRSAERVSAVLDLLCQADRPLRHAEVANAMSLPKSSASNLLDTLTDSGLISHDERGYSLGVKLIEFGSAAAERLDLRTLARSVLEELSQLGIGTSNLALLTGHEVLYIEKVNNPGHLIQIATRVGGTLPGHATALGKVMVANLPPSERKTWIATHNFIKLTERTITSARRFEQELARCRKLGYGIDQEESHLNITCVAAPVSDHTGKAIAAISLTCLRSELERNGIEGTASAVIDGARRVSQLLGSTVASVEHNHTDTSVQPVAGAVDDGGQAHSWRRGTT